MSYTVLAVKWRPKRFDELVGQSHVVQALMNSLAAERLHHAYLFSGTRGVGKTTIARILAKALNCEQGIVAEPCGECGACTAIDDGRFVDLIEVDAASRTRVDDTRELLDNVQYAPTHGRFKVYLIDEVHMLSTHSFNALLKTLEEPPPHVKFLLATTDPQKLPITVLSRCLQFNLKKLSTTQIAEQLQKICTSESIPAEEDGLRALARAADGSVRDALSLLDQSVAFGGGSIEAAQVGAMLGSIDRAHVMRILTALSEQDGAELIAEVERLDELAPDFGAALDELMGALQQIAVVQLVKGKQVDEDHEALAAFASRLTPEDVQLYYQIALHGRRDLAYCRDARMGFEMTLLRMLAFRPADAPQTSNLQAGNGVARAQPTKGGSQQRQVTPEPAAKRSEAQSVRSTAGEAQRSQATDQPAPQRGQVQPVRPAEGETQPSLSSEISGAKRSQAVADEAPISSVPAADESPQVIAQERVSADVQFESSPDDRISAEASNIEDWGRLLADAGIRGPARQLGDNCVVRQSNDSRIDLVLKSGHEHLNTDQVRSRLQQQLSEYLGSTRRLTIELGDPPATTPAERRAQTESARLRAARESIEQDSTVRAVQSAFGGVVEADTIQPIDD